MVDVNALAEQLVGLTIKEVNELAAVLKDKYGIEPAAAAVAIAAAPAGGGGEAGPAARRRALPGRQPGGATAGTGEGSPARATGARRGRGVAPDPAGSRGYRRFAARPPPDRERGAAAERAGAGLGRRTDAVVATLSSPPNGSFAAADPRTRVRLLRRRGFRSGGLGHPNLSAQDCPVADDDRRHGQPIDRRRRGGGAAERAGAEPLLYLPGRNRRTPLPVSRPVPRFPAEPGTRSLRGCRTRTGSAPGGGDPRSGRRDRRGGRAVAGARRLGPFERVSQPARPAAVAARPQPAAGILAGRLSVGDSE